MRSGRSEVAWEAVHPNTPGHIQNLLSACHLRSLRAGIFSMVRTWHHIPIWPLPVARIRRTLILVLPLVSFNLKCRLLLLNTICVCISGNLTSPKQGFGQQQVGILFSMLPRPVSHGRIVAAALTAVWTGDVSSATSGAATTVCGCVYLKVQLVIVTSGLVQHVRSQ